MLKTLQLIYGFLKYMPAVKGIINWGKPTESFGSCTAEHGTGWKLALKEGEEPMMCSLCQSRL